MKVANVLAAVGGAACVIVVCSSADIVRVTASSMLPSLHDGDYVIVLRAESPLRPILGSHLPRRRSIVLLGAEVTGSAGRQLFVKRVIAVGGDTVKIESGNVVLNGTPVSEPYAVHRSSIERDRDNWPDNDHAITVENGRIFVLGDNRSDSLDSRLWGTVPEAAVRGIVLFAVPWWRGSDGG